MRRVRVVVFGKVQGVFFRAETRRVARELGLSGWVRNVPDGTVEAMFEGQPEAVDKAIDWCKTGPPGAIVNTVEIYEERPCGEKGFRIIY